MNPEQIRAVLPIALVAVIFALRWRRMSRPRPFKTSWLWLPPVLVAAATGLMLITYQPAALGWLIAAAGLAIGAFAGIKRGQLQHLDRDPATGGLMIRQSPAAIVFVLGILAARRVIGYGTGVDAGAQAGGQLAPQAMLVTDGLLAFALGMVTLMQWTLWQRAKAVPAHVPVAVPMKEV